MLFLLLNWIALFADDWQRQPEPSDCLTSPVTSPTGSLSPIYVPTATAISTEKAGGGVSIGAGGGIVGVFLLAGLGLFVWLAKGKWKAKGRRWIRTVPLFQKGRGWTFVGQLFCDIIRNVGCGHKTCWHQKPTMNGKSELPLSFSRNHSINEIYIILKLGTISLSPSTPRLYPSRADLCVIQRDGIRCLHLRFSNGILRARIDEVQPRS